MNHVDESQISRNQASPGPVEIMDFDTDGTSSSTFNHVISCID